MRRENTLIQARTDALYGTAVLTAAANLIGTLLIGCIVWSEQTAPGLVAWILFTAVLLVARIILVRSYWRQRPEWPAQRWAVLATVVTGMAGVSWGLMSAWLIPLLPDFEIVAVVGVALSAIMLSIPNVSYWPAHTAFQMPLLVLASLGFFRHPEPDALSLALSCWLGAVLIALLARRLGGDVTRAMALLVENERLTATLAQRAQDLERMNRDLEELSRTDALTALANRRSLYEYLDAEWTRGMAAGGPLSVMLIDADHFKAFNDAHGHAAGDACLKRVAGCLAALVPRSRGLAARFGGEEFAVVLPGVDLADALALAEAIRSAIAAQAGVTVSVGVQTVQPDRSRSIDQVLSDADRALYLAKARGRDCVCTPPQEALALA
ncbi:GGDEF domain-containing protein [Zavarzinia sp. CC-PAN008]|uniref:GGDEF domain-containing protein n=1 Tax=Zavarzinia sp. CC-PAN008 TaxID=3243332 RepID=UPI003F74251B